MRHPAWIFVLAACAPTEAPAPDAWQARVRADLAVAATTIDPATRSATFPALQMSARFLTGGARVRGPHGELGLALGAWGRAGSEVALPEVEPEVGAPLPGLRLPDGTPTRRLDYPHDGLTEWFAGTPEGVEHGWTVEAPPVGDGPLRFRFRTDATVVDGDEDGLLLLDPDGGAWRYEGVFAWDADGEPLPAALTWDEHGPLLEVDDAGAAWPIDVDPVLSTASPTLTGPSSGSQFGAALASAGDVNGDGYDDVIVGAWKASSNAGRAWVYHGSASGLSSTATTTLSAGSGYYYCGYNVAGGADVNHDGYDDVAMACVYASGVVQVFHGSASGVSSTAAVTLNTGGSVRFGYGLAVVPSLDADEYAEVLVGAPAHSSSKGRVYVYEGSASGTDSSAATTLDGASSNSAFGAAIASAGDVDADGYGDVVIGAPDYSAYTGRASVYYGSAGGLSSSAVDHLAGTALSRFGSMVAGGGDVDHDGYDDVVVGTNATAGGRVQVHHGSTAGIDSAATTTLTDAVATGYGTAGALGDFDGDGYTDLAVGAYGVAEVYTFPGGTAGISSTADTTLAPSGGGEFGRALAAADVDADGEADLVVGDPDDSTGYGEVTVYAGYGAATSCAADTDGDGFAAADGSTVASIDGDCNDAGEAATGAPATDCDDGDAAINPDATEVCDPADTDEDCDGTADDSSASGTVPVYADTDGDGYGDAASTGMACEASAAWSLLDTDCDDTDDTVHPGATDTPGDAEDQDCDGAWDCYVDADGDGAAGSSTVASADASCADAGEGTAATDCNDADAAVHPGATEVCDALDTDENCDGSADGADASGAVAFYTDADGDGYGDAASSTLACEAGAGTSVDGSDCDDTDAAVHPGAIEACGDPDLDCDGLTGDDEPDITGTSTWYADADGDGAGDASGTAVEACAAPAGHLADATDCDDTDATVYPGATETTADGVDQDCDGGDTCYADADGDGARSGTTVASLDLSCADAGEADAAAAVDCDDGDPTVSPSATETVGDGVDQDCDGGELCYADVDGDGVAGATTVASSDLDCAGSGEADTAGDDCDDGDPTVYPGAFEVTGDELDQDCDGREYCYEDADDDGYRPDAISEVWSTDTDCADAGEAPSGTPEGDCDDADAAYNPAATESDCTDPADYNCDGSTGYDDADGDGWAACEECDDADAAVNPDGSEVAGDAVDQDCDGTELCYVDADGDAHRTPGGETTASADVACTDSGEAGADAPADDCDDAADAVFPGALESVADGVDQDCDGGDTCYLDDDDDGWRPDATSTPASADLACDGPGEATAGDGVGDCDDADPAFHPGADEADCTDPADYNCDGSTGQDDADADGWVACEDCDDALSSVNPDATEVCNERDDDCDGAADEDPADGTVWWVDGDTDGYGDPAEPRLDCAQPDGTAANDDDCDDGAAGVHPGATEVPDNDVDEDCSGADLVDTGTDTGDDTGDPARTGGLFGGCASGGASTAGAAAIALGLAAARRRAIDRRA